MKCLFNSIYRDKDKVTLNVKEESIGKEIFKEVCSSGRGRG